MSLLADEITFCQNLATLPIIDCTYANFFLSMSMIMHQFLLAFNDLMKDYRPQLHISLFKNKIIEKEESTYKYKRHMKSYHVTWKENISKNFLLINTKEDYGLE